MSSQGTEERAGGKMCSGLLWKASAESHALEWLVGSSGQHLKELSIFPLLSVPTELPMRIQLYHSVPHPNLWMDDDEEPCLQILVTAQHREHLGSRQTRQQARLEQKGAQLPKERMSCATNLLSNVSVLRCLLSQFKRDERSPSPLLSEGYDSSLGRKVSCSHPVRWHHREKLVGFGVAQELKEGVRPEQRLLLRCSRLPTPLSDWECRKGRYFLSKSSFSGPTSIFACFRQASVKFQGPWCLLFIWVLKLCHLHLSVIKHMLICLKDWKLLYWCREANTETKKLSWCTTEASQFKGITENQVLAGHGNVHHWVDWDRGGRSGVQKEPQLHIKCTASLGYIVSCPEKKEEKKKESETKPKPSLIGDVPTRMSAVAYRVTLSIWKIAQRRYISQNLEEGE